MAQDGKEGDKTGGSAEEMANGMAQLDIAEGSNQGPTSETTNNEGGMGNEPSPHKTKGKQEEGSSFKSNTKNQEKA